MMIKMSRVSVLVVSLFVATSLLSAGSEDERERLGKCSEVLEEILSVPDNLPQEMLDKVECVVIIPSVKKFTFGFGGSYGRGAMVCRQGADFTGSWGAPAMYRLKGASIGSQLGRSASDFLLVVMNETGADSLLNSKFKLGVDALATAGPKGLFVGVSLKGSTLRQDSDANEDLYGRKVSAREIVESKISTPAAGYLLLKLLEERSPRNLSN